jgi:hypothetical protein
MALPADSSAVDFAVDSGRQEHTDFLFKKFVLATKIIILMTGGLCLFISVHGAVISSGGGGSSEEKIIAITAHIGQLLELNSTNHTSTVF